jgi:hypothetical protein
LVINTWMLIKYRLTVFLESLISFPCKIKKMKIISTDIAELSFDEEESILHIKMLEDAHMNLEKTKEHYNIIKELTKSSKYLALIDATNFFRIDNDASRFAALPETTKDRVAAAHYTLNVSNRLTANFFRLFYKPRIPVQAFKTKEEALRWLKSEQINC